MLQTRCLSDCWTASEPNHFPKSELGCCLRQDNLKSMPTSCSDRPSMQMRGNRQDFNFFSLYFHCFLCVQVSKILSVPLRKKTCIITWKEDCGVCTLLVLRFLIVITGVFHRGITEAVLRELHGPDLKHWCLDAIWPWGLSRPALAQLPINIFLCTGRGTC